MMTNQLEIFPAPAGLAFRVSSIILGQMVEELDGRGLRPQSEKEAREALLACGFGAASVEFLVKDVLAELSGG